jgi:hypothetical protein
MKNILLIQFLLLSIVSSYGQSEERLTLTYDGVEPVIMQVEDKTAEQLYTSAVNWVKESYKNPDKVLKAEIEYQKIRLNGYSSKAYYWKTLGIPIYYIEYTIEVSFKDGRYKFEFIIGQAYTQTGDKAFSYKNFYKNNGQVRKMYKDSKLGLENTMNNLLLSFHLYVSGEAKNIDSDW